MTFEEWSERFHFDQDIKRVAEAAWNAGASNLLAEILAERERQAPSVVEAEKERLRRLKLQM